MYTLTIGDKAYSSWSLRGWLCLSAFDLPFEERLVAMYDPAFDAMQAAHAPARTVPQLEWQEAGRTRRIWDTMAIAETLAERHEQAGLWPADPWARAVARSLAAEMHSGFAALRATCQMNLHRSGRPLPDLPEEVRRDLDRLAELWSWALAETGGPWLGGSAFSVADAFYAPVAARLDSYALMSEATEGYARRLIDHPAMRRWREAALADPRRIARYELD